MILVIDDDQVKAEAVNEQTVYHSPPPPDIVTHTVVSTHMYKVTYQLVSLLQTVGQVPSSQPDYNTFCDLWFVCFFVTFLYIKVEMYEAVLQLAVETVNHPILMLYVQITRNMGHGFCNYCNKCCMRFLSIFL